MEYIEYKDLKFNDEHKWFEVGDEENLFARNDNLDPDYSEYVILTDEEALKMSEDKIVQEANEWDVRHAIRCGAGFKLNEEGIVTYASFKGRLDMSLTHLLDYEILQFNDEILEND